MSAELDAIERLLKRGKTSMRKSKVWESIHEETGAGTIIRGDIHFTPEDKKRLREYIQSEYRLDPMFDSRDGDRMAMAKRDTSEKLAKSSVFGQLLVMATAGNTRVSVNGEQLKTAPGSVISVMPDALDHDKLQNQSLVVVENGAVMPHWTNILLPANWQNAVLIYRGHGDNAKAVAGLVEEHPPEKLAFFYDLDPAGLVMGTRVGGNSSVLVPTDWQGLHRESGINQPDIYRNQMASMQQFKKLGTAGVGSLAAHIEAQELAVMQEHIVQRRMALTALNLSDLFLPADRHY